MDSNPKHHIVHSLIFLTNRVGRLLDKRARQEATADEVKKLLPHIGVLVDIWMNDGIRQQDLAVSVIKDKGTIARSLDILEQENLLVRVSSEQDKRKKRIYLTHRGKELRCLLMPLEKQVLSEATRGISPEEEQICRSVLMRMYHNLNRQMTQSPEDHSEKT